MSNLPKQVLELQKSTDDLQTSLSNKGDQPAQETPATTPPAAPAEDWEGRFKGLKRLHDDLVPQLRSENAHLRSEVDRLKAQPPAASGGQAPKTGNLEFSDEEREFLGEEGLAIVQRVVNQSLGSVTQRIDQVEQRNRQESERLKSSFESELASYYPNFRAVNNDPRFVDWLSNTRDPSTNATLLESLRAAHNAKDALAVANYFKQFDAVNAPPPSNPPSPTQDVDTNRSSNDAEEDGYWVYSRAEISEFYAKKEAALRKYKHVLPPEMKKTMDAEEAEIMKAIADGRIE